MQKSLLKQLPALVLSLFGLTASANDIEPGQFQDFDFKEAGETKGGIKLDKRR